MERAAPGEDVGLTERILAVTTDEAHGNVGGPDLAHRMEGLVRVQVRDGSGGGEELRCGEVQFGK